MKKTDVIYTRYSSDMQSPKSCEDQQREVTAGLNRMGFDPSQALVIHDEAESGTKSFRPHFERLAAMVKNNEIAILAVDDQSRLTRNDNAISFIKDLVFSGGRFISTGEGIDTNQVGWELRVQVMGLHNATTIRELGHRVRRGQLGRVLSSLSAGDIRFGYESYVIDPEKAANSRRGPKPEKGVRINEDEADCVRTIFQWFAQELSISEITRRLNDQFKFGKWTRTRVRRILSSKKYIGRWRWGATKTLRDSNGKKKQVPVPENEVVIADRPDLRIVNQELWERAAARLKRLDDIYGMKETQEPRGAKVHHTSLYPNNLLGGLIVCGKCRQRMWQVRSGKRLYWACKNETCPMSTQVPMRQAEDEIVGLLAKLLTNWPAWLQQAITTMRQTILDASGSAPIRLADDERKLAKVRMRIGNLIDQLEDGAGESSAIRSRLKQLETEAEQTLDAIKSAKQLQQIPVALPDDQWISEQFAGLPGLLRSNVRIGALLLRRCLGTVTAHHVALPGKKRGYPQLRFRIHGWESLSAILAEHLGSHAARLLASVSNVEESISDEFVINLGGPSRLDAWGPKIAEMRDKKVSWKEICRITGLGTGSAFNAWKRYVDSQAEPGGDSIRSSNGEA